MNSNDRKERVNLIIQTLNSLTIEEFLQVAQISGLKQSGGKWRGRCPIHGGDSKAFTVYQKSNGIFYNCPTNCGSGNSVKLIGAINNLSTKGRDFVSIMNLCAQRMGLPGLGEGELTPAQLAEIEKRKAKAAALAKERAEAEALEDKQIHQVCMTLFQRLQVSERVVSYLQERQLIPLKSDLPPWRHAHAYGVRSWDPKIVSELLGDFDRETLRAVLGPGDKLQEQIGKRPLLMFTFRGNQCTGFQARSIDPNCEKRWRYMSRGKTACGFFGGEQLTEPGPVVVVEGMTDTIMGRRYPEFAQEFFDGTIPKVIGRPGSGKMSRQLAEALKGRDVALVFDGDNAGKEGVVACKAAVAEFAKSVQYGTTDGDLCDEIVSALNG